MSQISKNISQKKQVELDSKLERIAREQGVSIFNFNEAINDLTDKWTDEDERNFEHFMTGRWHERQAEREAQKKEWQS